MWEEVRKAFEKNQNFLLTTHQNPDGDGIGSAAALTQLLRYLGKNVRFVTDDPLPPKFIYLDFCRNHEIYSEQGDYSDVDVMIILDTHRKERIGRLSHLLSNKRLTVMAIDHHPIVDEKKDTPFIDIKVIDPKSCSVGAMVSLLYKELKCPINFEAATGIYTSVVCDTARFSNSTTTSQSHKIADECINMGVDPDQIYSKIYQHVPLAQVKMFAHALQRLEAHINNRVLIEEIHCEDYEPDKDMSDLEHLDLEYIHEFNKLIEDVDCVVLLRELPGGNVRVSMRSMSDLDISCVMRSLGGGGHSKAAGLTCEGSISEIKQRILLLLKQQLSVAKS